MGVWTIVLTVLFAVVCLGQGYTIYGDDIPPIERLAIRNYILRNLYDPADLEPATRKDEAMPETKPAIPPNTFVSGGTGEGKQHLGSDGKIPNKQVAIPEIQSGYDTPPNPCPVNAKIDAEQGCKPEYSTVCPDPSPRTRKAVHLMTGSQCEDLEHVASTTHPESMCACIKGWDEEKEDCTAASKCCLMNMPNAAEFVSKYQQEARIDGFADPFANNQYIGGGNKRAEHVAKKSPMMPVAKRSASMYDRVPMQRRYNPYLNGQRIASVVAKKAPALANRLPVM